MPTLTRIEPCEPPVQLRDQMAGPSTPLDHAILRVLEQHARPLSLAVIKESVGATTHKTHARVRALQDRGLVRRTALPGGPRRGPGASVYSLAAGADR